MPSQMDLLAWPIMTEVDLTYFTFILLFRLDFIVINILLTSLSIAFVSCSSEDLEVEEKRNIHKP